LAEGGVVTRLREVDRKLVIFGDGKVGKTSLITKYIDKSFSPGYVPGTGLKVFSKVLEFVYPNLLVNLRMSIWDTAGQKWYSRIREPAFEGAQGIILVCDLSRPETVASIEEFWLDEVKNATGQLPIAVVGNKLDLITKRGQIVDMLESIGARNGIEVFLTSAKSGENVENLFRLAGERFVMDVASSIGKEKVHKPTNLREVTDQIVEDFISQHGNVEKALTIVHSQFNDVGMDLNAPAKKPLIRALEKLRKIEEILLSESIARANYEERVKLVDSVKE
jgi:small GTP-binding protein